MIGSLFTTDRASLAKFDAVIDVRSPGEFADDHIPGAINLPVLDNKERALVGTIYVQKSRFEARRLGAALVARNIASHLEGPLCERPANFAPLIYCWRGGQRSQAMATVVDQVGWRPTLLNGGYKTYRRGVCAALASMPERLILLSGHTGTAKTATLAEAKSLGAQVIDLEDLACHRGSLLGDIAGASQPSQKMFESRLAVELADLDPARPVLMEAESSKIGDINVPESLWKAMKSSPTVEMRASVQERAKYLLSAYSDLASDTGRLAAAVSRLPGRHGQTTIKAWLEMVHDARQEALAVALMEAHYDPAYSRWNRSHPHSCLEVVELDDLSKSSIAEAARRILTLMEGNALS